MGGVYLRGRGAGCGEGIGVGNDGTAAGQAVSADAEDGETVEGRAAVDGLGCELLERRESLGNEEGRVRGDLGRPLVCGPGSPQVRTTGEERDVPKSTKTIRLTVVHAKLLFVVDGGMSVNEEADGEDTVARLDVNPASPAVLDRQAWLVQD